MQKCIVVLGMHRSGTSALMGVLNILGVDLGLTLMKRAEGNPKGFFENDHITQVNDKILRGLISSWDDVFSLPENWCDQECLKQYKEETVGIMKNEFRGDIFGIKDPRMSKLLPFWNGIFEELNIKPYHLITLRNPLEVANSLEKRNKFSTEKSTVLWMNYMLDAEFHSRNYPRAFISFDELLNNPEKIINKISKTFNINFPKVYPYIKGDIEQFLEPSLKHYTFKSDDKNESLLECISDYYHLLQDLANEENLFKKGENNENKMSKIDEIRKYFLMISRYFYNADITDIKKNVLQKDQLIQELLNSISWKLTKPFREIQSFLKSVFSLH